MERGRITASLGLIVLLTACSSAPAAPSLSPLQQSLIGTWRTASNAAGDSGMDVYTRVSGS